MLCININGIRGKCCNLFLHGYLIENNIMKMYCMFVFCSVLRFSLIGCFLFFLSCYWFVRYCLSVCLLFCTVEGGTYGASITLHTARWFLLLQIHAAGTGCLFLVIRLSWVESLWHRVFLWVQQRLHCCIICSCLIYYWSCGSYGQGQGPEC